MFRCLRKAKPGVTMDDISAATSMTLEDIYTTLQDAKMIVVHEAIPLSTPSKLKRGRGRPPKSSQRKNTPKAVVEEQPVLEGKGAKVPVPRKYDIVPDQAVITSALRKFEAKNYLKLRPERLKYTPFLTTRDPALPPQGPPALAAGDTTTASPNQEIISTPSEREATPEGQIAKGKDKATLDLVAALSASPVRSLRKRSIDVSPGRSSKRIRSGASSITPRRSLRGDTSTPGSNGTKPVTPRKRVILSEGEDAWGEEDAEGEEEEGEEDAEGEDE